MFVCLVGKRARSEGARLPLSAMCDDDDEFEQQEQQQTAWWYYGNCLVRGWP